MADYPDLKKKVVLVTGGANGIGASMVAMFAAQGARVRFCDIDESAGGELAQRVAGDVRFSRVDLTVESEIVRWIASVVEADGPVDCLINNAAADPRIPFDELAVEQWDGLFARNLRSAFIASREALKSMLSGAAIINFSSITFHEGPAKMAAYVATKAGVQGLTRSLAREVGPRGIRVNTITPGWIMTERQLKDHVTEETKAHLAKVQSIPTLITPDEVAEIALFLASDASRAVTGQEILVDRGWYHS